MIRVVIVAESESHTTALAALLSEDDRIEVISSVDPQPDVLLVRGVSAPFHDFADIPVVILTEDLFETSDYRNNIKARLPANATAAELLAAIHAAAQGLIVLTNTQAESLFPRPPVRQNTPALIEALTSRELQILRSLAQGSANKEIADELGISEHTVKFHVASILGKMQVGSRTEAVSQGIRRGLIPI